VGAGENRKGAFRSTGFGLWFIWVGCVGVPLSAGMMNRYIFSCVGEMVFLHRGRAHNAMQYKHIPCADQEGLWRGTVDQKAGGPESQ